MIDPSAKSISIASQCKLLNVSRSSFYYQPKPMSEYDLKLMRLIDELYLEHPCRGSRSMRNQLDRLGYKVNRKKIQRLMRMMGIQAVYPKPRTTIAHAGHKVYPYLLRNLNVDHPNQVWASDISVLQQRSLKSCVRSCMRDGGTDPPRSACRGRPQTTLSGIGQKPLS